MSRVESMQRHYRALLESEHAEGQHPADRLVADVPDVREVDAAARAMAAEMSRSVEQRQSIASWTEYEDLRFQQRCVREERFFDVGYEMGCEAGIAQYGALLMGPMRPWFAGRYIACSCRPSCRESKERSCCSSSHARCCVPPTPARTRRRRAEGRAWITSPCRPT